MRSARRPALFAVCVAFVVSTCAVHRPPAYLAAMAAGERAVHAGRFSEAAEMYALAQRETRRPLDRDEAVYRRAQALRRAGRATEALAQFDWLAANGRLEAREDRAAYEAARIRLEAGAVDRAEADVLELVRRAPETGVAPRALEMVLRERDVRDPTGALALRWIDQVWPLLGASAVGPRLLLEQARRFEHAERFDDALAAYEALLARGFSGNAHFDDGALAWANLLMRRGRPAEAAQVCERALRFNEATMLPVGSNERPQFPALALLRGRALRAAGDLPGAARAFRAAYTEHRWSRVRDDALDEEVQTWRALGDTRRACEALLRLAREFACSRHGRAARAQLVSCGATLDAVRAEPCAERHEGERETRSSRGAAPSLPEE